MSNNCKYYKQQKQFSTNSGETWSNVTPYEYRRGSLIESDSPDCQEEIKITRFITIPDAFLCDGKDKYEKQVAQYSLDNGATWQYYYPSIFQLGNLLEANADICNNKWEGYYSGDTANICSNGYTYVAGRGCVKNGGSSNPCRDGYRYSTVTEKCAKVDPVKYVRASSTTSTTLTRDDVNYPPYRVYAGLIGDCVTSIGTSAFTSCSGLTDIIIPNSVTDIGDYAFQWCTSLTSINIPSGVTTISSNAFNNCRSLSSVTIGNGVTSIGASAFQNCTSLSSVTIGNSVTSIGDSAFRYCSGLTSITINAITPPSLGSDVFYHTNDCSIMVPCSSILSYQSEWGDYAFRIVGIPPCEDPQPTGATKLYATYNTGSIEFKYCDSTSAVTQNEITSNSALTSVVIGDCVTEIDDYAFSWCSGLTSVTIGNSVTNIGYRAFNACRSLTSVVIPNSMTSIETQAFQGCYALSSVTIANSVTSIGDSAFDSCGLISVSIPNSITELSSWIFYHCASLTSVTIPNSVTSIGQAAFAGCTSLSSVTIGNSVSTINQYAFNGCTNLTTITTYAATPPFLFGGSLDGTNISTIYVPCGTLSAYQSDKGWSAYTSSMVELACPEYRWYPSGYTCNGLDKYQNNIKQESYDSGQTWANVVPNEFSASTLIEIDSEDCGYVPPSDRKWTATYSGGSISMAACDASSAITNGEITKSKLISVEISDCVTSIGASAFQYCSGLTSVTIPNSVNYIGILAFGGCWGLTSVIIGSGITTLDNYAFDNCSSLTSITINATTPPTLGWDVFSNTNRCPIYVPSGSVETYKTTTGWSSYASRIQPIPST